MSSAAPSPRIACVASDSPEAVSGFQALAARNDFVGEQDADVIVALGGDGFMLDTLRARLGSDVAVYGMHRGSVGFLMNEFDLDGLPERIASATAHVLYPLRLEAECIDGGSHTALGINEVSMMRRSVQAAHLAVSINGVERLERLVCDGLLVATPAGSTAYNLSAHGPVLPLDAELLALTPISPFRPRRWRGALLPQDVTITVNVLDADKRPVNAGADSLEVADIACATIHRADDLPMRVLFDPGHSLEDRILGEQFHPG